MTLRLEAEVRSALAREDVRPDRSPVACALYVAAAPDGLTFLTLDERQRAVAKAVGFRT